jgi:hypothetical protein
MSRRSKCNLDPVRLRHFLTRNNSVLLCLNRRRAVGVQQALCLSPASALLSAQTTAASAAAFVPPVQATTAPAGSNALLSLSNPSSAASAEPAATAAASTLSLADYIANLDPNEGGATEEDNDSEAADFIVCISTEDHVAELTQQLEQGLQFASAGDGEVYSGSSTGTTELLRPTAQRLVPPTAESSSSISSPLLTLSAAPSAAPLAASSIPTSRNLSSWRFERSLKLTRSISATSAAAHADSDDDISANDFAVFRRTVGPSTADPLRSRSAGIASPSPFPGSGRVTPSWMQGRSAAAAGERIPPTVAEVASHVGKLVWSNHKKSHLGMASCVRLSSHHVLATKHSVVVLLCGMQRCSDLFIVFNARSERKKGEPIAVRCYTYLPDLPADREKNFGITADTSVDLIVLELDVEGAVQYEGYPKLWQGDSFVQTGRLEKLWFVGYTHGWYLHHSAATHRRLHLQPMMAGGHVQKGDVVFNSSTRTRGEVSTTPPLADSGQSAVHTLSAAANPHDYRALPNGAMEKSSKPGVDQSGHTFVLRRHLVGNNHIRVEHKSHGGSSGGVYIDPESGCVVAVHVGRVISADGLRNEHIAIFPWRGRGTSSVYDSTLISEMDDVPLQHLLKQWSVSSEYMYFLGQPDTSSNRPAVLSGLMTELQFVSASMCSIQLQQPNGGAFDLPVFAWVQRDEQNAEPNVSVYRGTLPASSYPLPSVQQGLHPSTEASDLFNAKKYAAEKRADITPKYPHLAVCTCDVWFLPWR